jgi:hypothetical protein
MYQIPLLGAKLNDNSSADRYGYYATDESALMQIEGGWLAAFLDLRKPFNTTRGDHIVAGEFRASLLLKTAPRRPESLVESSFFHVVRSRTLANFRTYVT